MFFVALAGCSHAADEPSYFFPEEGFVGWEAEVVDLFKAFDEAIELVESGILFCVVVEYPCHGSLIPDVVAVAGEFGTCHHPGLP